MRARRFSRCWGLILTRGLAALAFGLTACVWPARVEPLVAPGFGAYALIDGLLGALIGLRARAGGARRRLGFVIAGVFSIVAGVCALALPGWTDRMAVGLIAGWAFATGIVEIAMSAPLRREDSDAWLSVVGGLAAVIFSVLLAWRPMVGGADVVWAIGWYVLAFGGLLIAWAAQVKGRHARQAKPMRDASST